MDTFRLIRVLTSFGVLVAMLVGLIFAWSNDDKAAATVLLGLVGLAYQAFVNQFPTETAATTATATAGKVDRVVETARTEAAATATATTNDIIEKSNLAPPKGK